MRVFLSVYPWSIKNLMSVSLANMIARALVLVLRKTIVNAYW